MKINFKEKQSSNYESNPRLHRNPYKNLLAYIKFHNQMTRSEGNGNRNVKRKQQTENEYKEALLSIGEPLNK